MTLLAPWAVSLSALQGCAALLVAVAGSAAGFATLWRESRRPHFSLVVPWTAAAVTVDGEAVDDFAVHWRGPLASAAWTDASGARQRCLFWPDTLPPALRRELRLAAGARLASSGPPQVAP